MLKVRWAFDPFADHTKTWDRSIELLNILKDKKDAKITPTYVIGSETTAWLAYASLDRSDIQAGIEKDSREQLKKLDPKGRFEAPEVFDSPSISRRTDANSMVEHLKGYDALVINTHARKGVERFFLGSFAESTLLKSRTPIFFVSPHTEKIKKIERIFFPTDLTDAGKEAFEKFIKGDLRIGSELVLYTKVIHPASTFSTGAAMMFGGGNINLDRYIDNARDAMETKANEWKKLAEAAGAKTEVIVDDTPTPLHESIMNFAKSTHSDMVAMPSFASKVDTILAGSTARDVLRRSTIPVLVWHVQRDAGKVTLY